ncbi:GDNF family receptor alpha-1-like isoform X2 [Acanthaster planci]|uniref:GDNF family receptor alpha-1-like isoform X2 n=1 Tax=Acanthaster planci TaxID=133434 RepID=A0A8B7YN61_ACAPL|nr:GDNF family receptor alpha-1-like isoform X2 [Acanthaster planci]
MGAVAIAGLYIVLCALTPRGLTLDCKEAQVQCNEDHTCAVILMMVPDLCGNSASETTCDAPDRVQCEGILQILRQSQNFRGCSCDPDDAVSFQECEAVYSQLYKKQCSDSGQADEQEMPTETMQDTSAVSPWQYLDHVDNIQAEPSRESTCIEALNTCNFDITCRQSLYDYLTECRGDPATNSCRRTACRQSIRAFLDSVSPRYTHPLLYCYCDRHDAECDMVWRGLNAECAYKLTPLPSCLEVKEQCARSALCRTNFENYKFQCAISDTTGTGCAQSYSACRDARLGILGTIVAASCTCRSVEGTALEECKEQQRIVLDNSCFTRASQDYYPLVKNQDSAQTTTESLAIINKRVKSKEGCAVKLWNGYPDVHVPRGQNIRIANDDFAVCTQICRCIRTGYLSQCFDVLCNVTHPCNEAVNLLHEGSQECICTGGEQVCIDKQRNFIDVDKPAMMIGYSVMEYEVIRRQLHVSITSQSFVSKLQSALSGVFMRNPCKLAAVNKYSVNGTDFNGTIVISAHSEHRQNWECLNQLSDLATMINTRAPPISSDVILSLIKIAGILEVAPETQQGQPQTFSYSRSAASLVPASHFLYLCLPFFFPFLTTMLN